MFFSTCSVTLQQEIRAWWKCEIVALRLLLWLWHTQQPGWWWETYPKLAGWWCSCSGRLTLMSCEFNTAIIQTPLSLLSSRNTNYLIWGNFRYILLLKLKSRKLTIVIGLDGIFTNYSYLFSKGFLPWFIILRKNIRNFFMACMHANFSSK